jgi:hypothetical protein
MGALWKPKSLGQVIARRELRFRRGKSVRRIVIGFGRPVRKPRAREGEPWWTPVRIDGPVDALTTSIAGEDAVQSLVLALRFAESILPHRARKAGGRVDWLGERSKVIFGPVPRARRRASKTDRK